MTIKVKKEEAVSGVIRSNKRKVIPCRCPACDTIFLLHKDVLPANCIEGPCPNCNTTHMWNLHTISPMKYKFIRYWRMLNGEA